MSFQAAVITCSDRAFASLYEDRSGPVLRDALTEAGGSVAEARIVPDDADQIKDAILSAVRAGARVVVTTGGTGIAPHDVTVEAVRGLLDYEVPGLMEEVRRIGAAATPLALLSRGVAGVLTLDGRRSFVLTAPGSRGGARDTMKVVSPLLDHLIGQLDGADHPMD